MFTDLLENCRKLYIFPLFLYQVHVTKSKKKYFLKALMHTYLKASRCVSVLLSFLKQRKNRERS